MQCAPLDGIAKRCTDPLKVYDKVLVTRLEMVVVQLILCTL